MIGVYGMGGVGKTTLAKAIDRQAKGKKLFAEVVFVEVPVTPDITKIQTELGYKLRLTFTNETEKADKLYERLKKETKTLVILDNLWADLDLKKIGIPSGVDRGGCKLLLTSRDRHVLVKMGVEQPFLLGNLSEEDAWSLFKKINSGDFLEVGELMSLAQKVCMKCGGLPVAIVAVAKALKNNTDKSNWKDAIRQFERPSPEDFEEDHLREPYLSIQLSYEFLRGEELKRTFLLCSLMGHEASILDLAKYAMGLNIYRQTYTMGETRDRISRLIQTLKNKCLLLNGNTEESFSMHDFIREVAISIAKRDDHVFSVRNQNEWEWPGKNTQETCTKIFIRDSEISEIPEILECPELISFALHKRHLNSDYLNSDLKIPDNFFLKTTKLKVLDLTRMPVFSLRSSSLDLLKNLQTLCLDRCKFGEVAVIGELKELKILSLRYSYVEQLPSEIGQLTKLRFLDLSGSWRLEVIAPNLLSNLVQLEELYMRGCSIRWEVEQENVERTNASLEELRKLSGLTTLEIYIKDDKILPKGLFSKTLERYKISIGDGSSGCGNFLIGETSIDSSWDRQWNISTLRTLNLKLSPNFNPRELQSFKNVEFLCLAEWQGIKNVLYDLDEKGFSQLKHLRVHNNPNLLCIVDSTRCERHDVIPAFPVLDSLILFNLRNLNQIYCGHPTIKCFCKLKIIEVESCGKLKNLFSPYNARGLPQIQRISVDKCQNMEEIFTTKGDHNVNGISEVIDKIEFCQLRFLRLRSLPRLTSFYSTRQLTTNLHSNDDDELENGLETLTSLFDEQVVFPSLEELDLYGLNIEKIWNGGLQNLMSSTSYQNLTHLTIRSCDKLKYVFPSFMVESFKQLKRLEISGCLVLEEIVGKEEGAEANATFKFPEVVFPHLEVMNLQELNILKIWDSQPQTSMFSSCQSLVVLTITGCNKLKYLFPSSNMLDNLKHLQSLTIRNCEVLEEVVAKGREETVATFKFPKVTNLFLQNLPELMSFCQREHISEWPILTRLNVDNCVKLQISTLKYKVVFSNLEVLDLQKLDIDQENWDNKFMSSFCHTLKSLTIRKIKKLKYVFLFSMVKSFEQLDYLKIGDCKVLEGVVAREGGEEAVAIEGGAEAVPKFNFPKLTFLKLQNLPKLTALYPGTHTSEWPMLKKLMIDTCDELQICTSEYKINIPNLEELELGGKNTKLMIWQLDKILGNRLRSQRVLEVKSGRAKLSKAEMESGEDGIQAETSSFLRNLQRLEVGYSDQWINVAPPSASFQNLTVLLVYNCERMVNLISSSTAKSLTQLRRMTIESCPMMIQIVESEGDAETDEIVFSNLKRLVLSDLQNLAYFYSGNCTLNFPSLEQLTVKECPNMMTFSEGICSSPKLQKDMQHDEEDEECLDDDEEDEECSDAEDEQLQKKEEVQVPQDLNSTIQQMRQIEVNSDLEELTISGKDILPIWEGHLPKNFDELKVLHVIKDISANIPIQILQRFNNLQKLILRGGSFKEIFSCGKDRKHAGTLSQIKRLELWVLLDLNYIWKQGSELDSVLPNLEFLGVHYCHNLITLVPSSTSFENLKTLEVTYCDGLINLFTSSMAKSLTQFEEMKIEDCRGMTEVVANEGNSEEDEIVLHKLKSLSLIHLSNLTCFCSGNHTFKFPALEELIFGECHKMKTFCRGTLSTPRLQRVKDRWPLKEWWEGDLNTTIQKLHNEIHKEREGLIYKRKILIEQQLMNLW